MATVKVVLNKDREKKEGGYSLVIQIIHKRVHRCVYTAYALKDEEFDTKKEKAIYSENMRFTRKEVIEINRYTTQIKGELEKIIENFTLLKKEFHVQDVINEHFQDKSNRYLTIFTERLIEKRTKADKMGQAKAFHSTLISLKKFIGDREVIFNDITHLFVSEYGTYLLDSGIKDNTISYYMRNFRVIVSVSTMTYCMIYSLELPLFHKKLVQL